MGTDMPAQESRGYHRQIPDRSESDGLRAATTMINLGASRGTSDPSRW